MNITVDKGDLLKFFTAGKCDAIAHCCNCQGVMGSGIAAQIKAELPEAYSAYKAYEDQNDGIDLGSISGMAYPKGFVFNLHAQNLYGYDGSRFVDYEALYKGLSQTRDMMLSNGLKTLGLPYLMACDRAGGGWRIIEAMLEVLFENSGIDILVIVYEPSI